MRTILLHLLLVLSCTIEMTRKQVNDEIILVFDPFNYYWDTRHAAL